MELYQLLKTDSSRIILDIILSEMSDNPVKYEEMINYCLTEKYPIDMRAARIVDYVDEKFPGLAKPHLSRIIHSLKHLKTDGVKRNFARLLRRHIYNISEDEIPMLIDQSLSWVEGNEAIAVKAFAMDILIGIGKQIPEINQELNELLYTLWETDLSSGLKNKIGKILKIKE